MSNNYVPNESDLLPGELARSADINLRYSNVVAGFDLLPTPLGSGQTGFSVAVNVGTPTADAHAVTKLYATTTIVTAAEAAALVYIQPTLAAHLAATTVLRDEAAASATASANSAAASQTSRLAAETAETNAETAETNAETAETSSIAAKNASQTSAAASASSATASAGSATSALASKTDAATSATNSAASAVTSNTAKTAALTAQAAAETAETNAEAAESNVVASASAAATSAASALTSKNSATASATSATSSASSASGSAGTATTKANESTASASAALASQNSATTSATTATNQAAISTTKAGEASTSASAAATSSSTATTQAGIATTKASESSSSATAAASSASAAAASFEQFDDIYLGAKSSAPTVDNDGNALATGALYFNTVSDTMFVYSGSTWAAAGSAVNGTSERQEYTATSGQTSFNATYDVGFVDVYLNGSRLVPTTDFTATNGSQVVLTTGATTGDNVGIIAYGAFNVADVYTQAQSNARYTQIANNLSDLASASTALTNLGLTATAAEVNVLDGIPATLTATELGYVDGVTSNIQTQLNTSTTAIAANTTAIGNINPSPTLTAVASGTLANGDTVIINADGTVTAAGFVTASTPVIGSIVEFNSTTTTQYIASAYDTNANKVVIAYRDGGTGGGKAVVGTVASGAITFGTPVTYGTHTEYWLSIAFDANANKVVIAYYNAVLEDGIAVVGTVSGTSLSFGSSYDRFSTNAIGETAICFDSSANKVIIAWFESNTIKVCAGTISGTSLSYGSVASTAAHSNVVMGLVYDANANKSLLSYRGPSNYGTAAVISLSGTTASIGTPAVFVSESVSDVDAVYDSSNNKTLIVWRKPSNNYGAGIVATISGTSVTFGSEAAIASETAAYFASSFDTTVNKSIVSYYNSSSGYSKAVQGTISGTGVTFSSATTYLTSTTQYTALVYDPDSERTIFAFGDIGDSQKGKALLYSATTTATNLTTENYIGISDAAYSNGAAATIQLVGTVDDAQSSLTAGQSYFVQDNGSLALTAGNTPVFAGTAVSATKLLIGERNIFEYPSQTGNSGKFLTTNGTAASWADTSAGWKLITTVSGTNALTFLLNNVFSDSYYDYIVEGNLDTNSTYPNPIGFEFIKSGGSYQTSDYRQVHYGSEWTGSGLSTNSSQSQYYSLSGQYLTNGPMYLRIQIARPQTSSGGNAYIYVQSQVNALYSTEPRPILSNGGVSSSQDYIGLRIKDFRSGPATLTGSIRVWARKTS